MERICPRCGSKKIISADKDGVVARSLVAGINYPSDWVCGDCEYFGPMVEMGGEITPGMMKDLKNIKKSHR